MIYKLEKTNFAKAKPLFQQFTDKVGLWAILEGNIKGDIYVDNVDEPEAAFVWNEFRYSYLSANPGNKEFENDLFNLLDSKLLPAARSSHDPTLVFYPVQIEWNSIMKKRFPQLTIHDALRKIFKFEGFSGNKHKDKIPNDLYLLGFSKNIVENYQNDLRNDILFLYENMDNFFKRNGFGFSLVDKKNEKVISTCFSVFISKSCMEIDVRTDENYRRQGLAEIVCKEFINCCREKDITPVWECWNWNESSIKLAHKLGFKNNSDNPVSFFVLK